jgi:hypothetical protein
MDALTHLVLAAKAKEVFEKRDGTGREETFLSFPNPPLVYSPDELQFGKPAATPQSLSHEVEFACTVNLIPRGVLWPVDHAEYLWNVYDEVLGTAQVAPGALGSEDQARLDAARSVLYEKSEDWPRPESAKHRAYRRYRDAHITAQ